jgi:hypothetical protein
MVELKDSVYHDLMGELTRGPLLGFVTHLGSQLIVA